MKKLTKGQKISLDHHLSIRPANIINFENICDMIYDANEKIEIWEPFEHFEKHRLIESIMCLADLIDDMATRMSEE